MHHRTRVRLILARRISRSAGLRAPKICHSDDRSGRNAEVLSNGSRDAGHMTDTDTLRATLDDLLRSGTTSNPALNRLLDDYTSFHLVLVPVGSLFMLGFVALTVVSWRGFRRATTRTSSRRRTFEKRTWLSLTGLGGILVTLSAVVIAANVSNVLDPRRGFAGSIGMIGTARAGTPTASLHQSFTMWLQSDSSATPPLVQRAIDDRLAWQQPKALISTVLFFVCVWLCVRIWRALIIKSRLSEPERNLRTVGLSFARWGLVAASFLLMLMVIGNTQASLAPLALTLFNT